MKRAGDSDGSGRVVRGARGVRGVAAWALMMALAVGVVASVGGCGPSKKRPKEADVSAVPSAVVESFRRGFPNGIILKAAEVPGAAGREWKVTQYTPRAEKKVTYYNVEGDKLRGW